VSCGFSMIIPRNDKTAAERKLRSDGRSQGVSEGT
jgi:hypothetical protein